MTEKTCMIASCEKLVRARGWCAMHYKRWLNHGDPLITIYGQPKPKCSIIGCNGTAAARSWCDKHYQRWQRNGDPLLVTREEPGKFKNSICRVDECDGKVKGLGLCSLHYSRWCKYKSTDLPVRQPRPRKRCSVQNCRKPVECREMCGLHYQRWRVHGDPHISKILLPVASCAVAECGNRSAKCGVCWKHYRYYRGKFFLQQDGKCAICRVPEEESPGKKLSLDHDHQENGLPRGLLCKKCNSGLGMFEDNPDLLLAAVKYLAKKGQLTQSRLYHYLFPRASGMRTCQRFFSPIGRTYPELL